MSWSPPSPRSFGRQAGAHTIERDGIGFTPPLWEPGLVDGIMAVKTACEGDGRRLAREEGAVADVFGGDVAAAIGWAGIGPNAHVVHR